MIQEVYIAQDGKLFCKNPHDENGPVEVAVCSEVSGLTAHTVAIRLASRLNSPFSTKDKASEKDDILHSAAAYLMSVDSKDVPGALRDAVLQAYEI